MVKNTAAKMIDSTVRPVIVPSAIASAELTSSGGTIESSHPSPNIGRSDSAWRV